MIWHFLCLHLNIQSTVRKPQRFLFCLSPCLFSEWHDVPLGKQTRGLSRFLSKFHPASGFCQQTPSSRFLSSNTHSPLKGQSPSRHTIIRTTLRFLYLPPRLMDIPIHLFRQPPLLRQFLKRLYQVLDGIFRTIHIIKILPVLPIQHIVKNRVPHRSIALR